MIIPAAQQKSVSELITIYCSIYKQLLSRASAVLLKSKVLPLLNEHMETAFKLTVRNENHYKNRAYQWL